MDKNGVHLSLALAANGILYAELSYPTTPMYMGTDVISLVRGEVGIPSAGSFAPYAGCYTVQMPAIKSDGGVIIGGISLILKMTSSSAIKSGKMAYSAVLPNGKIMSGTALLSLQNELNEDGAVAERAWLPLFVKSSRCVFGALLSISPNGSDSWQQPMDATKRDMIGNAAETVAYCLFRGNENVTSLHEAYGSWFAEGSTPVALCERFGVDKTFDVNIEADGIVSERYGNLEWLPAAVVNAGVKFKVESSIGAVAVSSYATKTGIIKGRAKISFENKTITGKFAGIVLPGWNDCQCEKGYVERPFVAGSFWFTDYLKIAGRWKSVVRSVPFEFLTKTDKTTKGK